MLVLADALETLDAADRALVSLCYERGLDDERLGRMSGIPPARLRARRSRMLARLERALGVPPEPMLAQLAAPPQPLAAKQGRELAGGAGAGRRRRRRLAGAFVALTALVVAAAAIAVSRADARQPAGFGPVVQPRLARDASVSMRASRSEQRLGATRARMSSTRASGPTRIRVRPAFTPR